MELQSALTHRPGKDSAIALFNKKSNVSDEKLKHALATILNCFSVAKNKPQNLHILVALNPKFIGQADQTLVLPKQNQNHDMPSTQNDVLIQVAAMTGTDAIFALRVVNALLTETCDCVGEYGGGQLRYNQEPFGFYHENGKELEHLDEVAKIPSGDLEGGSWLLYQLYEQNLPPFYQLSLTDQIDVIGGESAAATETGTPTPPASSLPDTAHTKVLKSPLAIPEMVRRGFPCRYDGIEGTVFIAASANTDNFSNSLDRMLASDAILNFTQAVQGGIYFVPPSGEWLDANAPTPELPNDAKYLPLHMQEDLADQPLSLEDYTVAAKFVAYINALREGGLFVGKVGEQTFNEQVTPLLVAINEVMAGGDLKNKPVVAGEDPAKLAQLNGLMQESLAVANRFNKIAKTYMTIG